ncbi:outer membrane lipoprotein carrier protein LolA [uncultured Cyclobacterium sp.]|uniref:LolA family protein n=1 Tax=uncultured Cyclobacterium sp. TaxID=453820 RepID=UPI0030EF083F|tara:strand:+ start:3010 stop:3648 length:639 start_codon:yes stop_codon:yes gene_type:complete
MKRITLSLLLLFIACFPGLPQEDTVTMILSEAKANLERMNDFSADFTYSIENKSKPVSISKKGKFQFAKGKYVLLMDDQEIFCDGKSMWIHIQGDEEVNILHYDPEDSTGFDLILSPFYEEATKSIYEGKKLVDGITYDQIYLEFSNPELDYHKARLWIDEASKILEKIVLVNRRQTISTYQFTNIKTDQGLPESTFVFDIENFNGEIYDER